MADGADAVAEQLADTAVTPPGEAAAGEAPPQVVTPWDVQSGADGIDYDKLLTTFGCQPIDAELVARCVTGPGRASRQAKRLIWLPPLCTGWSASRAPRRTCCCGAACSLHTGAFGNYFLCSVARGVLASCLRRLTAALVCRDLKQLLDLYEADPRSFYLYTGRVCTRVYSRA